jgi:Plasmid pRiA4b ORF-3-like protein
MNEPTRFPIYQLRAVLNGVSPLVWRRFLLSSETSLADLHKILQLAFGWSDFYMYEFRIHRKTFGSNAEDPRSVCLSDFRLRPAERFHYRTTSWHFGNHLRLEVPLH